MLYLYFVFEINVGMNDVLCGIFEISNSGPQPWNTTWNSKLDTTTSIKELLSVIGITHNKIWKHIL